MNLRRDTRSTAGAESGQAMVEFSLVAVVFMTLVMGIIEFAMIAQAWVTVQHASQEGARFASTAQVDCPGITGNRNACITDITKTATTGIPGGGSGSAVVNVAFEAWQYPAFGNPSTANTPGGACDAMQVVVTYTHQIVVPVLTFLAPSGITLVGKKRTLVEPYATCGT